MTGGASEPLLVWPEDSPVEPLLPSLCGLRAQIQLVGLAGKVFLSTESMYCPKSLFFIIYQPVVFGYSSRKQGKNSEV